MVFSLFLGKGSAREIPFFIEKIIRKSKQGSGKAMN